MTGAMGTRMQGTPNYALPYYSTGASGFSPANNYYYNPVTGNYYAGGYASNNPYVSPYGAYGPQGTYGYGPNYYPYAGANGSGVPQYGNGYGAGNNSVPYGSGIPSYQTGYGNSFGIPYGSGVPYYGPGYGYGY